jgi:hypothetical protein
MVDLILTVMLSAFSLAQPGPATITTNELAPPPGMSNAKTPAASKKPASPAKRTKNATLEKQAQPSAENAKDVVTENARPAGDNAAASPEPSAAETAQPTTEEAQTPTAKQAGGSGSQGRVAAFWFILPNRPPGNK